MRFRLYRQQGIDTDDRGMAIGRAHPLQLWLEGSGRINHGKEFKAKFLDPGCVFGIGKGRYPPLPCIVDQHRCWAEIFLDRNGERLHLLFRQHVAHGAIQFCLRKAQAQHGFDLRQALLAAAAQRHCRTSFQQQFHRGQADAGRAAGDDSNFTVESNHAHAAYPRHMLTTLLPDFSGAWSSKPDSSVAVSRTQRTISSSWAGSMCGNGIVAPIAATTLPE